MADKEATVYVVDIGVSMGKKSQSRSVTDLDWAMTYVWDKITSIMAKERKTTLQGLISFKSDGTQNELNGEDSFANISVLQELTTISLPELKRLRQLITPSSTDSGDVISAIVIAIQMIARTCKKLKYIRKIVVITNGRGACDPDNSVEITRKIVEDGIELVILGVDFDDAEYGFKEEGKSGEKAQNEATLKTFTEDCGGIFGSLGQAIDELGMPRLKSTRPIPSYKGQLTLGDPEKFDTAMCIDVERYPKTYIRRPATASSFVPRTNQPSGAMGAHSEAALGEDLDLNMETGSSNPNSLALIRSARTYQVIDESSPGGKKEIDTDDKDLAKGYEYGRTAVHISEADQSIVRMDTKPGLEIIGFIPVENYEHYMSLSKTNLIIAQRTNTKAIMALSSFIHALQETETVAIARFVAKADKAPVLLLLAPLIEPEYECLIDVEVPFAEDVRPYKFPPLDRVVTVSGKIVKEHRNIPDESLLSAMSDYVDSMDISSFGKDDEGYPADYLPVGEAFSPVLHHIDQAIRFRAVHPDQPLPAPYEILTRFSHPPPGLATAAKGSLEKVIAASKVKKVPPKAQSRRRARETVKPSSGLDVNALLSKSTKSAVDANSPIPSFRQMLDKTTDPNGIQAAATQLGTIIESQIRTSFGDAMYSQAIEEMQVLRQEMIEMEEPGIWNDWLRGLKARLLAEKIGGDRREFWWEMRRARLGLVEGESTGVASDEAKAFLALK